MGRRAAPSRNGFFSGKLWAVLGIVLLVAITAGVTAYFVWPSRVAGRSTVSETPKVTKEEILSDYNKGKIKELAPKFAVYLNEHKNDYKIRSLYALTLVLTGDADRATKEYKTLIDAKPGDADILYQAGIAMGQLGRVKDAIDYVGKAVKASPNVRLYHAELARLLAKDGQNDAAITEWQQVLQQTAADDRYRATIYAEMASVYVAKGQPGAAKEIVDNGLKLDPQNDYLKALSQEIAAAEQAPTTNTIGNTRGR